MNSLIPVVFRKEVVDNLRDRRTLAAALFYPLLGPAMIFLMVYMVSSVTQDREEPLELPVVGAEHAPNLMLFLRQNDVVIQGAPEDPEEAVRSGEEDLVLVVEEKFGELFQEGRPATVRLVVDDSRDTSARAVRRADRLLAGYGRLIGRLRLQVRGVDPAVTEALLIERLDVSTPQSQAARFLSIAPYFIIFSIFIGGMYLAIDATAGERERGSLEPLLINPVPRRHLVFGKMSATLLFTAVAVAETVLGFSLLFNYLPIERYLGVRMTLPLQASLMIFVMTIPMMFLAVALQFLVASSTKSFKEAQNYITFLTFVPAVPALILSVVPVKVRLSLMLIPMVGQQLLINQIMRGEAVQLTYVAVSAAVTLAIALAVTWVVIWFYGREKILFR